MAHEWDNGVLINSSWHIALTGHAVEALPDSATQIRRGEETGAWPIHVRRLPIMTADATSLIVPGAAIVAEYHPASGRKPTALATVGDRYTPLDPAEWRATVEAAVVAGAKPAGAFSLRGGTRVLATFEIPGGNDSTGIRNFLTLADSYDGTLALECGGSSIRVVCANTLAVHRSSGAKGIAKIRHTSSINDRAKILREAIEAHVSQGVTVREAYRKARELRLTREDASAMFDRLWPAPTEEQSKSNPRLAGRLNNVRSEAVQAMARPENSEGPTLATLWNAATWLVDRDADGSAKPCRGDADRLDSLLYGSRRDRVEEIRTLIDVYLADGTLTTMEAGEAVRAGVDPLQAGRAIVADLLGD